MIKLIFLFRQLGKSPGKYPIADITQQHAINACRSMGPGYHLITNNQWMTIARNIESKFGEALIHNGVSDDTILGCDRNGWDDDGVYNLDDMQQYGSALFQGISEGRGNVFRANGVSNNYFRRGGPADDQSNVGIYTLNLNNTPGNRGNSVGFRCAR